MPIPTSLPEQDDERLIQGDLRRYQDHDRRGEDPAPLLHRCPDRISAPSSWRPLDNAQAAGSQQSGHLEESIGCSLGSRDEHVHVSSKSSLFQPLESLEESIHVEGEPG